MSLNSGYFPLHNYRRKQTSTSYQSSSNNQRTASLRSARSPMESTHGNESFLPTISTPAVRNDGHRPHHQNDFANNHLFIAKRKLAGILLGQKTRNLQSTSDLIHLFDQPESRQKKQNLLRQKQQGSPSNKTSVTEQDAHLSVVDLVIKPPHPFFQTRDPINTILQRRRSQIYPSKVYHSAIDTTPKQNFQSTSIHTFFTDNNELDDEIENDNLSETISTSNNLLDSSILCVKSIIPLAGPQHTNHYLLQHR